MPPLHPRTYVPDQRGSRPVSTCQSDEWRGPSLIILAIKTVGSQVSQKSVKGSLGVINLGTARKLCSEFGGAAAVGWTMQNADESVRLLSKIKAEERKGEERKEPAEPAAKKRPAKRRGDDQSSGGKCEECGILDARVCSHCGRALHRDCLNKSIDDDGLSDSLWDKDWACPFCVVCFKCEAVRHEEESIWDEAARRFAHIGCTELEAGKRSQSSAHAGKKQPNR